MGTNDYIPESLFYLLGIKANNKVAYDVSKMLSTVDVDEKMIRKIFLSCKNRNMWFLTEQGLYEVLFQSSKPIAKEFKKEVKKILKQIRTTGGYIPARD